MQRVEIQTTQNVVISHEIAGIWDRILANIIDSLIIFAYIVMCIILIGGFDYEQTWIYVLIFLPAFFYHLIMEISMNGQSPGKKQMNIKVVKMDGSEPGIGAYLIRWIVRPVDISFSYSLVAILCILIGGKGQRLGDIAAGTSVIKINQKVKDPRHATIKSVRKKATDYEPVFPEVQQLTDKEIRVMNEVLRVYRQTANKVPADALAEKTMEFLKLETDMTSVKFLNTVIKDYYFYNSHD